MLLFVYVTLHVYMLWFQSVASFQLFLGGAKIFVTEIAVVEQNFVSRAMPKIKGEAALRLNF